MNDSILVFDDVIENPQAYRERALACDFRELDFGADGIFKGIASYGGLGMQLPAWIGNRFPGVTVKTTFLRKSPVGQIEPNFIHTDSAMGDWTAILYLNENPPDDDGTDFWCHKATVRTEAVDGSDLREDWSKSECWLRWRHVQAAFNRLLLFPAPLFHSRAIRENYGEGEDARLIQVAFGTGSLSNHASTKA